jgi:hypothetical protein
MNKALPAGLIAFVLFVVATIVIWSADWTAAHRMPPCRLLPTAVSVVSRLDDAPAPLVQALTEHVGEVVPAGALFDTTDVITFGKDRRLIFVWNRGTRWVVATEHGGFVYNDPVFAYELNQDDRKAVLLREEVAFPDTVCATASALLVADDPTHGAVAPSKDAPK